MSFVDKYGKKSSSKMTAQAVEKDRKSVTDLAQKGKKSPSDINKRSPNADLIYLVKGVDDSRSAWYYVLVERLKVSLFLKALNDDIIHLESYGKILYSAYGEEPPKEITNKIKKEFGVSGE